MKSMFLVLEEKQNKIFFFVFFLWFNFKNNTRSVFFKSAKKSYLPSKTPFQPFLVDNNFFCIFKNTDLKNFCASVVLKIKTKEKYDEDFLNGFLF